MSDRRPVTLEELGKFEINEVTNKLYWDGKPIKAENVHLSFLQKLWAFLIALGAVLATFTAVNKEFCLIQIGKTCNVSASQSCATPENDDTARTEGTDAETKRSKTPS